MTCNEALMKMKETLASIPPMKRLNTAPFLSYQRFMTVTQGSSVHQAVSPARSRNNRVAAGKSVDDPGWPGTRVSCSFRCHGTYKHQSRLVRPEFKIESQNTRHVRWLGRMEGQKCTPQCLRQTGKMLMCFNERVSCANHFLNKSSEKVSQMWG